LTYILKLDLAHVTQNITTSNATGGMFYSLDKKYRKTEETLNYQGKERKKERRGGKKSKNTPSINSCLRPCELPYWVE